MTAVQHKVYFLDDEPDICSMFADNFADASISIRTFTDPKDALLAARSEPPVLFFIDFRLPGTTGDEVAEQLDPSIPVVLLSGDLDVETKTSFVHKLSKAPFPWREIEDLLARYLRKKAS